MDPGALERGRGVGHRSPPLAHRSRDRSKRRSHRRARPADREGRPSHDRRRQPLEPMAADRQFSRDERSVDIDFLTECMGSAADDDLGGARRHAPIARIPSPSRSTKSRSSGSNIPSTTVASIIRACACASNRPGASTCGNVCADMLGPSRSLFPERPSPGRKSGRRRRGRRPPCPPPPRRPNRADRRKPVPGDGTSGRGDLPLDRTRPARSLLPASRTPRSRRTRSR